MVNWIHCRAEYTWGTRRDTGALSGTSCGPPTAPRSPRGAHGEPTGGRDRAHGTRQGGDRGDRARSPPASPRPAGTMSPGGPWAPTGDPPGTHRAPTAAAASPLPGLRAPPAPRPGATPSLARPGASPQRSGLAEGERAGGGSDGAPAGASAPVPVTARGSRGDKRCWWSHPSSSRPEATLLSFATPPRRAAPPAGAGGRERLRGRGRPPRSPQEPPPRSTPLSLCLLPDPQNQQQFL